MKLDISLFRELHDLAVANGITQTAWAAKSGMAQQRIAEYLAESRGRSQGRQLTAEKYILLCGGMMACLGRDKFKAAWAELINNEDNVDNKLIKQTILIALYGDEEAKKRLCSVLELFTGGISR